ncbi:hypothetical protein [Solitalea koreensis]|uniref:Uncharacterized protein n=1 Tax=Solitalea koreensis TaxID=543615 RepID=A0A521CS90_9SPHI|nr:hypothetical protein [Solitalea koreensis]SMO62313.1 hypothetical protein SAMN06265350_104315 [Solitalea koreensis]
MKNLLVKTFGFEELSAKEVELINGGGHSKGGGGLINVSVGDILSDNKILNDNFNGNKVNILSIVGNLIGL